MKNSQIFKKMLFTAILTAAVFVFNVNIKAVCTIGSNLIVNGDAEADQSFSGGGFVDHDVSNWDSETGSFTVVRYTAGGGFPTNSDPGPAIRGNFFFAGGPGGGVLSSGTQIINVADCAADIDANRQPFELSGFFGGFGSQPDIAQLTLTFKNASNASVGSVTVGPVTATERGNITGLLSRNTNGIIPAGTRTVEAVLSMPPSGGYNDGYADNLSFILNTPTAANASISGRITTAQGNGIRNVIISLTTPNGGIISTRTGTFGYYRFEDLPVGETYILSVSSKRYTFANPTRIISLQEDLTDEDFVAEGSF
jgi:hypothetical protein